MRGTSFQVEFNPRIPQSLCRLSDLANDLYYSWDRYSRGLFYQLDSKLWHRCGHNPTVFLRRVAQARLDEASKDRAYLESYHRALANYDAYIQTGPEIPNAFGLNPADGCIAYLCAEFGLHESFPIYSGGLGILAGDLCKSASDLRLPFIAVGLLYRYGNFVQEIDGAGRQHLHSEPVRNDDLPIERAVAPDGSDLTITIPVGNEDLQIRAWWARAGHARLLLLDTECEANGPDGRCVTHNLYPGDASQRLRQEIVLGIGGAEALAALGIAPRVWHVNEGHPALVICARAAHAVSRGFDFSVAIELVAANTVFTTHTPVAAGHEKFSHDMIRSCLGRYCQEHGVPMDELLALGADTTAGAFSLTALALRCSACRSGVSRMHGEVAARMEARIWPEIEPEENPVEYVTNGVHVPTFLAREWIHEFDATGWRNEMCNPEYWRETISAIPDEVLWSVHRTLKLELIHEIGVRTRRRRKREGWSNAQIRRELNVFEQHGDPLVVGFARRFAAYKRATLLLRDPARLHRLLTDPERPVVIIFAGRAHQNDEIGQGLLREVHDITLDARFHGRVFLLEGYDLALARKLVSGVDVWINTPEFPHEASGTSGMKAGINGAINLSIADGWWREGFDGTNGWSIEPHPQETAIESRQHLEAEELMDTLESEVIPAYFDRSGGYSSAWIEKMKASMRSILPNFNAQRMLSEYVDRYYLPLMAVEAELSAGDAAPAVELAAWRRKVREHWPLFRIQLRDTPTPRSDQGTALTLEVEVHHDGLATGDFIVECLVSNVEGDQPDTATRVVLDPGDRVNGATVFAAALPCGFVGLNELRVRAYPHHRLLHHRFDMGLMRWL